MKKLSPTLARRLLQLMAGESLPASQARFALMETLIVEGLVERRGRIQKQLSLPNPEALQQYLQNKFGIHDLARYVEVSERSQVTRAELTKIATDSKLRTVRTFKGFLLNSYQAIDTTLDDEPLTLNFTDGIFQFIYDYETFKPAEAVTIIGIENPENFRFLTGQKHWFSGITPLFVSRYPQNQSKDLIKWLQTIPNPYLHFGDFDPAGIGIYLHEFKKHLGEKAQFFVPDTIEDLLIAHGNHHRYDQQIFTFTGQDITEKPLHFLLELLHRHKKGLDQEALITVITE